MISAYKIHEQYNVLESWFYDSFIATGSLPTKVRTVMNTINFLPTGARILDIGCGGGQVISEVLKLRPDLQITGIDNTLTQIEKARERLCSSPAVLIQASALELPFPDSSFDFVYSLASMKHWPDREQGLREALRVLRPGSAILLTELDRRGTLEEVRDFISRWRIPRILNKPIAKIYFLKIIQNSLAPEEITASLVRLGAQAVRSYSFLRAPAFVVEALKPELTQYP